NPYILSITLLVAFLHTRYHVSFRACALILLVLRLLFAAIPGNILGADSFPRQLSTVFLDLGLRDRFKVHPICSMCHRIFDAANDSTSLCPDCGNEIYRPLTQSLFRRLFGNNTEEDDESIQSIRQPLVVAPIQLLSNGLQHLFSRPGVVAAVNSWKTRERNTDELRCIQDGAVWNTIKGHDDTLFFFGGDSDKELRIGVSFNFDWFGRKTSNYGPSHSSGAMSF
ncbi:hypothetical protein R3P38DRAFT_2389630, partial [Favolaschia claudopus]